METNALGRLSGLNGERWPSIAAAASLSREKMKDLSALVGDFLPTDEGALVVFGSLARGEFTVGSDLDWTILIDGRADARHLDIVHSLRRKLEDAQFHEPGPTGVFGGLVFSHDLIHEIGGDDDTNKNMTRRLLLLLESASVDAKGSKQVHDRIVSAIINRSVSEDPSFLQKYKEQTKYRAFC